MLLERGEVVLKTGQLVGAACRREGTGEREQNNALAFEEVFAGFVFPAEGVVAFDAFVAHARFEGDVGNLNTGFHRVSLSRIGIFVGW